MFSKNMVPNGQIICLRLKKIFYKCLSMNFLEKTAVFFYFIRKVLIIYLTCLSEFGFTKKRHTLLVIKVTLHMIS